MHIVKPTWVVHPSEKEQPTTVFSIHVHPDGSRIATGALDQKIRIWSTLPILSQDAENDPTCPKLLCTLTAHGGPVMTVRWAPVSGRFLASGSDDRILMIWELDDSGAGSKVWGTSDVNVENWKAVRRCTGHESDVANLAWSEDEEFLASVGFDNQLFIWDGHTFECLRKIAAHDGFVKGVVWDPVGQFLATMSDDKTMKIWRTFEWGCEAVIREPFEGSPLSAFFQRLSWSPDGTHITTPNSMNGPVFVASVVDRGKWKTDISLVGHPDVVEVTAFNPVIFLRNPKGGQEGSNLCTALALAARNSISIWLTNMSTPLVVVNDVFDRDVLDLSWSPDGTKLYSCSSEGHVAVFHLDLTEFGPVVAPAGTKQLYHRSFRFERPRRSRPLAAVQPSGTLEKPNMLQPRKAGHQVVKDSTPLTPQKITIVNGKRRIQPAFLGGLNSSLSSTPSSRAPTISSGHHQPQSIPHQNQYNLPPQQALSFNSFEGRSQPIERVQDMMDARMNGASDQPAWGQGSASAGFDINSFESASKKRKIDDAMAVDPTPSSAYRNRGRTLGGDRPRDLPPLELREIRPAYSPGQTTGGPSNAGPHSMLVVPPVRASGAFRIQEGTDSDVFEFRNLADPSQPSEVAFVTEGRRTLWLDYLPRAVVAIAATPFLAVVSLDDGSLIVYSPTGRRLAPTLNLDAPCAFLAATEQFVLAITARSTMQVWNMRERKSVVHPISCAHLGSMSQASILTATVVPRNGSPIIFLSNGQVHSYDVDLHAWVCITSTWWSKGSEFWEGRVRGRTSSVGSTSRGRIKTIETQVNDVLVNQTELNGARDPAFPIGGVVPSVGSGDDWITALSLGHLEVRLFAAQMLESPGEWRTFLTLYAKKLADEGFRSKAEELIRELLGPIYYKPERNADWKPTVAGVSKRDALREVLSIFARSRLLTKLGTDYQDVMKRMGGDDD